MTNFDIETYTGGDANNAGGAMNANEYMDVKLAEFMADNSFVPSAGAKDISSVPTVVTLGADQCS